MKDEIAMPAGNFDTRSIPEQPWFSSIRRPSRYLGGEINSVRKDPAKEEVSIALAFPDVYEVGMSHLGLKILYHILNSYEWLTAERVFCPWVDLEKELRERRIPLPALESNRPLLTFDIVGFSLQHELTFTNVLSMLELSGIPFLSDQRERSSPLVIAGGPACFNPEPVAPIFDAIVIGDGEEAALEICRRLRKAKLKKVKSKKEILSELTEIRGVYVPAFFKLHYNPERTINTVQPLRPDYKEVRKAIVSDMERYPFPSQQVVPFTELVHDRLAIEISRGCTRGCRFCQAGMIYRPVRERNPESIVRDVEVALSRTGFEETSLLSLSSGDYSCIGPLLKKLMDRQSELKTAVSLPSLRVDSLDPVWFEQIKRVRKTGFTLAPEAGNDRLRRKINKGLSNTDILNMAREIYGAGWNLIKLYFMIGLPGEKESDLKDIAHLAKEVSALAKGKSQRAKLHVSLSTFVPKSHTPFMWVPQISLEESRRRIRLIRGSLKDKRIRVKWNQPEMSWLEGIFSRGDRRLIQALKEAWRMGARFDAWTEHFKLGLWQDAFNRSGLDPDFYLYRFRSTEEVLPWDHIKSGVTRSYLRKEWEKSTEDKGTPDCRRKCLECGVCDHKKIDPVLFEGWSPSPNPLKPLIKETNKVIKKCRMTFSKTGSARYIGHLELVRLFIRAFKRTGLNLVFSQGFHPKPKVSFASALPVGMESIHETVDIQLYGSAPALLSKEGINRQLPSFIRVTHLEDITRERKTPRLRESHFLITFNGLELDQADVARFLQSEYFPIAKTGKKGEKIINARQQVNSLRFIPNQGLSMVITHRTGPELKASDILKGVFHLSDNHMNYIRILKTKQVMDG
jgi:radical SAM family uncharacterized protein/radical SAM-linked protein